MASQYDKIKTAKDLLVEIRIHGRSTVMEDVVRMQDIFGHSAVEDLVALANDKDYSNTFYSTLFAIWSWEDATRFYNENSNKNYINMKSALAVSEKTVSSLENKLDECKEEKEIAMKNSCRLAEEVCNLEGEIATVSKQNADLKMEIMALKAKLYDLMTQAG